MLDKITEQPFCQTRVMCRAIDNLELLLSQPDESVDLIYCDILYGTGRNFGDYQDLKPIRSEIEAHYLPRLKEMHRVLKSTGSIYIHCDWHINHWIRCLMDDVFGYERFINEIIWCYTGAGVKSQKN
jgi:DNA modification methylase